MYARHKIREAEFFWQQVKNCKPRTEEHAFYFAAFFSAFRSITFVLQSQYKKQPGFQNVYEKLLAHLGNNQIFRDMKEARNIVLKEGSKVPVLVTRFRNETTNDVFEYECDPLPEKNDVIRKVTIDIGFRENWFRPPPDYPEEDFKNLSLSQLWHVMNEFPKCTPQIEQLVRIAPDGEALRSDEIAKAVEDAFAFINQILPEFERLAGGDQN